MLKYLIVGLGAISIIGAAYFYQGTLADNETSNTIKTPQDLATNTASEPITNQQATAEPKSKFVHFNVGNQNVKSIFEDNDLVWVGTSGGLIRYDLTTENYRHFNVQNGLLSNGVFHVSRINEHLMAVGTYGGGLSVYNEKTDSWVNYNVPNGLGDAFVYDLLTTKTGDIWIATWTGVNRIINGELDNPDAWQLYTVENTQGGVPNDWIYGLAEGTNGEIWLATEGGLARYKDQKWQNWQHEDGLGVKYDVVKDFNPFKRDPAKYSSHHAKQKIEQGLTGVNTAYNPNYIISMDVASNGDVWVGTWGAGLNRFDGETWQHYTHLDGLPSNHIFMITIDDDDTLWIGTNKGVAKKTSDKEAFTLYGTEDGLFGDSVFSMAIQNNGTLWIGSYGGVARISKFDH